MLQTPSLSGSIQISVNKHNKIDSNNKTKIITDMQRISRKVSNDPVLLFDWIMCILFGLLALGGIVLLFLVSQKQVVMGSTLGLALMSLMYSPLFHKSMLIRIILIIVTIGIAVY